MPAAEEELEGALDEGNLLEELATPVRVMREDGRVVALECQRNRLGEPGADGRRRPVPVPGSEFRIPTDAVIVAVGQLPELSFLDGSTVTRHRGGGIEVDTCTGAAGPDRVYAGGDVVVEPASIIAACADGRRAPRRRSVPNWASPSNNRRPGRPCSQTADILAVKRCARTRSRQYEGDCQPPAQRIGFQPFEKALSEAEARAEALRCVQCTTFCDKCVEVCPNRANYTYEMAPVAWTLPQLACSHGSLTLAAAEPFRVVQTRQILHVDDYCNECDDCQTFCVHHGKPYTEKPRLFLREADFLLEQDNAFFIEGSDAAPRGRSGVQPDPAQRHAGLRRCAGARQGRGTGRSRRWRRRKRSRVTSRCDPRPRWRCSTTVSAKRCRSCW